MTTHIALDEYDGDAARLAYVEDEPGEVFLFLVVHPGHRLVHQQNFRLLRERVAEVDTLAQAISKCSDRLMADRSGFPAIQ